ncbi:MAG UNVERIFIED_CONTAM: glutamate--tRNA ligase [Rickettsiaceae bacterium]
MTKANIITRFAPSPTGFLHVGNTRTALINFLYTKKFGGKFILRIDDTDKIRSTEEYKEAIIHDLKWLGLDWDDTFMQSARLDKYDAAKEALVKKGRLYKCYETAEELEIKRKLQLSSGKPPIYDRSALKLTDAQIQNYEASGRKPHYRFLIEEKPIEWKDLVKGDIHYDGKHISDPIVIREDGSMTYMLCSTVDDAEYNITHIIRGEDHVSNTAVQIQMFEALGYRIPNFGHLALVKTSDDKISKRKGGFEIANLRDEVGLEAMAINSFFASIGSANPIIPCRNIAELTEYFDISKFSTSPTTYMPEELIRLNHKMISNMSYDEILENLKYIQADYITEEFWLAVRPNLNTIKDAVYWWKICHEKPELRTNIDNKLLQSAIKNLPEGIITEASWKIWTNKISEDTEIKGKELFLPLRLLITGMDHGPEMAKLLPLIGRNELLARLITQ